MKHFQIIAICCIWFHFAVKHSSIRFYDIIENLRPNLERRKALQFGLTEIRNEIFTNRYIAVGQQG